MRLSNLALLSTVAICAAVPALAADQVNIVDPAVTARVAHVDAGNRLAVQEVPPSTYFHSGTIGIAAGAGCATVATAPAGKALIVRQVRLDVYLDPSPGSGQIVSIDDGACETAFSQVNPPTIGPYTVTFDPGLIVPAGSSLSVEVAGSVGASAFVDGYTVAPSVAPITGEVFQTYGKHRQQQR